MCFSTPPLIQPKPRDTQYGGAKVPKKLGEASQNRIGFRILFGHLQKMARLGLLSWIEIFVALGTTMEKLTKNYQLNK